MHRRLALLLLWVGLLGPALPALACPLGTSACCPAQDSTTCSGGAGVVGTAAALCCSSAPVPAYVLSIGPADPRARALLHASGSPDALGEDRGAALPTGFTAAGIPSLVTTGHRADAQLTYLHTGRLRL